MRLEDVKHENDLIVFYARSLTASKAATISRIFRQFHDSHRGEVASALDNQIRWFWLPAQGKGKERRGRNTLAEDVLDRTIGEPGYDLGRHPSAEGTLRFLMSRPAPELRAFLAKETTAGRTESKKGKAQRQQSGGSDSDAVFHRYALALGNAPESIRAARQLLASACRAPPYDSYPHIVTPLVDACRRVFWGRGGGGTTTFRPNPNPDSSAVSVEHLLVFLCGRSAADLALVKVDLRDREDAKRKLAKAIKLFAKAERCMRGCSARRSVAFQAAHREEEAALIALGKDKTPEQRRRLHELWASSDRANALDRKDPSAAPCIRERCGASVAALAELLTLGPFRKPLTYRGVVDAYNKGLLELGRRIK